MNTFNISRAKLRESNVEVFRDTMDRIKTIPKLWEKAEMNRRDTIFFPPEKEIDPLQPRYEKQSAIIVSGKRTAEAAMNYRGKHIALLNFASAWTPGGGVLSGSSAQEESLCRISTLYPALQGNPLSAPFYDYHHSLSSYDYSDAVLFTPDVIFFKSDGTIPEMLDEEDWLHADVITSAAPNLQYERWNEMTKARQEEIRNLFLSRIDRILTIAASAQADVLILGAFGCGAFHNPPDVVAKCFKDVIQSYSHYFETIEFAVFTTPLDDSNYRVFKATLHT
ncbi:MAG: TIGR02452 family protein [Spirochaetes bacterium]|uniref:TIGR02452 family protein n=1 Tax=Candidatus Ornithospirochaeta stercoripullorum TaxID=2840899 RepID=A0A9D9DYR5_9SPIO|nr:TIGR02452 family protein [Candidatus Ornithospirochaeta stercoripullorum]